MAFEKGHSGNPVGRLPLREELARANIIASEVDEEKWREVIRAILKRAAKGNLSAASWLWERQFGKVPDVVFHGSLTPERVRDMTREELEDTARAMGLR